MRVGVVDYRMGNLASVAKALERVGAEALVSADPEALGGSDLVVVPGVGNFAAGMANLRAAGLDRFLVEWAGGGGAVVGICLGMQLLFDRSEEGDTAGLGILPGAVVRLQGPVKVPHMGWNEIVRASGPFEPFEGRRFYFVHSYVCVPAEPVAAAWTTHGREFVAAVAAGRVLGSQFHPEKSSADGLALLGRMLEAAA